ncbi:helix-turn-helix transcriptional regulator [Roseibacterium beibuensis]|uniref:winged helix-turn-helix transcriptional regulator n=1 Tax=[Roseibacterium] beibuensis TaxID=1193142 RepID=UPI00217DB24D|nr:helix-turn-helix domain-containing protein [Roseibacterium beibuensis]MCS6622829.1 helix-turn-helix transcriptional regulator [Roseibacterium beibuensis]
MKLEKITGKVRRRFDDACGTAHGLELLGERWALLIVRELMLGPRRFGDLRASLPGLSANVLTQRLEQLEAAGIAVRRRLPPPASVQVYDLTDWGREAEPIISELGRWAARSPGHDPTLPLSPVSMMLSFRTMFDPGKAGSARTALGFRFGAESFVVRVADGVLIAARAEPNGVEAVITGTPEAVAGAVYSDGAWPPEGLRIEGDAVAFQRFARWFELPPKAPAA